MSCHAYYEFGTDDVGVLHVVADAVPLTPTRTAIYFSIDCSGSMDDTCKDGRTKMHHIQHTLRNILRFLIHKQTDTSVHIVGFDHNVTPLTETFQTCDEALVARVDDLYPNGLTNLEQALEHAHGVVEQFRVQHPDVAVYHILMTDGCPTAGAKCIDDFAIPWNCPTFFVGFGEEHDNVLLSHLAEAVPRQEGRFQFIDEVEHASIVYGELLHQILYPCCSSRVLYVEGMEVYHWQTNTWTRDVVLPPLAGEEHKLLHLRAVPDAAERRRAYVTDTDGTFVDEVDALPALVNMETGETVATDMTPYQFRQETLALLFQVNRIHSANMPRTRRRREHPIKQHLWDHFNRMKAYTCDDPQMRTFVKVLMDDVYIAMTGLHHDRGHLYSQARQRSQGAQSAYMASPQRSQDDSSTYYLSEHLDNTHVSPLLTQTIDALSQTTILR